MVPDLKELFQCKEYKEYDIKKSLACEIREWIIPMGNSEEKGVRMLLFKIPKNQSDRKPHEEHSFERINQNNNGAHVQHSISIQPLLENNPSIQIQMGHNPVPPMSKQKTYNKQKSMHKQRTNRHHGHQTHHSHNMPSLDVKMMQPPSMNNSTVQRNLSFAQANSFKPSIHNNPTFEAVQEELSNRRLSNPNVVPMVVVPYNSPSFQGTNTFRRQSVTDKVGNGETKQNYGRSSTRRKNNHSTTLKPLTSNPLGQGAIFEQDTNSQVIMASAASARETTTQIKDQPLMIDKLRNTQGGGSNPPLTLLKDEKQLIDMELLKFERQETDDMDEDDQEQLETERIDVKKDIALDDGMMKNDSNSGSCILPATNGGVMGDTVKSSQPQLQQQTGTNVQLLFQDQSNTITTNQRNGDVQTNTVKDSVTSTNKRTKLPKANQVSQSTHTQQEVLPHVETDGLLLATTSRKADDQNSGDTQRKYEELEGDFGGDEDGEEDYGFMDEGDWEDGEYFDDEGYEDDYGEDVLQDHATMLDPRSGHNDQDGRSQGSAGEEDVLLTGAKSGHAQSSRQSRGSMLYKSGSEYQMGQHDLQKAPSQHLHRVSSHSNNLPHTNHYSQHGHSTHQNLGALQATPSQHLGTPNTQKKHDYARIVTNPKYKYYDEETCGSAYFNDCNASEKEIDIRETIKKRQAFVFSRMQTRRRRKAKKDAAQEAAILAEANKSLEEGAEELKDLDPNDPKKKRVKIKENDTHSRSQSRGGESLLEEDLEEEEALKDDVTPGGTETVETGVNMESTQATQRQNKTTAADERAVDPNKVDEGEQSSIASVHSQTRTFFSLKQAIDEKFVPNQIRNLNYVANVVWLGVLLLSIAYFSIQSTLFEEIQSYIQIIVNSEKRIDDIMTINLKLTDIALINEGLLLINATVLPLSQTGNQVNLTQNQVIGIYVEEFLSRATSLKDSQTELSTQTASLDEQARMRINPNGVSLQYFDVTDPMLPKQYLFNIWEAIIQISVFAYSLAESPLLITHSHPSFKFISVNCMNSVLSALKESTQAIVEQSDSAREYNTQIFLILVVGVSGALLSSMGFLLPVIRRAKENRQEVFVLLTNKKVEKQIEEQLKKCRWFITKYQQQSENQQDYEDHENHLMSNAAAAIEENAHMPSEKGQKGSNDEKKDDYISKVKKQRRKWRPLNSDFLEISIKLLVVLLLIEVFFLYNYLVSKSFLEEVSLLTKELRLLISRHPQLEFLILMEKELVYSNSSVNFLFQPVTEVAEEALRNQNQDYESLLTLFQSNYYWHTDLYNSEFESLIYNNVCTSSQISSESDQVKKLCSNLNQGILERGMYNSVVKYWADLKRSLNDYFGSKRTQSDVKVLMNSEFLYQEQQMMETFLAQYHLRLGSILKEDINAAFDQEFASNRTVFAVFVLYVLFVYLVLWKMFMQKLLEELWRAKACLSHLPVESCFRIEEIRTFIYKNSSGLGTGTG